MILLWVGLLIPLFAVIDFMNRWLSNYSYRIELSLWIFLIAGLFCLFISFFTVLPQRYQEAISTLILGEKSEL